ncbi:MAG: hypothetical protein IJ511_07270 [Bacteroides sp.]|nr:hypothetical protein [Bacteroides sp.]
MFSLLFLLLFLSQPCQACTSAVVSGRATPDGRPLLWKNRDTDFLKNHIAYVKGERYDFIANVNSATYPRLKEAWMGCNAAGFALMNTQSYNLMEMKEGEERGAANGRVIHRALELCATVQEFCHFLDTLQKPSYIEANFGVIDARGGAAILEVDYEGYTLYDANDPQTAPDGYLLRTNYSVCGRQDVGGGYVRQMEAERQFPRLLKEEGITPHAIFNHLSRSFNNCKLGIDLRDPYFNSSQSGGWFVDQDFIPRSSTSCSIVVQGTKKGEPGRLTTMWTLLGYPPTGVAVPLWVREPLPGMVRMDETLGCAPLSHLSLQLADVQVFCYKQGIGTNRYLCWKNLYREDGSGLMQQAMLLEDEILRLAQPFIRKWRKRGEIADDELEKLYHSVAERLTSSSIYAKMRSSSSGWNQ